MKKNILISLITLAFSTTLFAGTIQPQISMRYNDVIGQQDLADLETTLVLGFAMDVGEGVLAGFDSDGNDSRIFVSFNYGTMGMGITANGQPQFTIGTKYRALSNLDVSLDYIINNLTDALDIDGNLTGVPDANTLRMSLGVTF
jgi:hypothetical protein